MVILRCSCPCICSHGDMLHIVSVSVAVGTSRALPAERSMMLQRKREKDVLPVLQPVKCFSTQVTGMSVCFMSCCMWCWAPRGGVSVILSTLPSTVRAALGSSSMVFLTDCGFPSHYCNPAQVTVIAAS